MRTGNSLFQSRNRGSFDFKAESNRAVQYPHECFNLVIEVLLISRQRCTRTNHEYCGFNLVIEVLLISRSRWQTRSQETTLDSFNLVIEVLLISSQYREVADNDYNTLFQSRNRGSFDFKVQMRFLSISVKPFQSRNRGSFDFKFFFRLCTM